MNDFDDFDLQIQCEEVFPEFNATVYAWPSTLAPYFNVPTQLEFWDEEVFKWVGGIGIGDTIIDGRNGQPRDSIEIYASARGKVRLYDDWISLSEEIIGD